MGVKESARQAHVLETALTVFARHGFSKTSIEDIAKAAGISRKGIYLHFKNKDEIFSASIQKTLDDGLQATNKVFEDDRLTLEAKLLKALDEWFGRHVGLFHPEASDLRAQSERLLGDAVEKSISSFQKILEKVILASSAKKTKSAEKRAATIADMLCACGLIWKHSFSSRQEFLEKMGDAIHLCYRDLSDQKAPFVIDVSLRSKQLEAIVEVTDERHSMLFSCDVERLGSSDVTALGRGAR